MLDSNGVKHLIKKTPQLWGLIIINYSKNNQKIYHQARQNIH